MCDVALLVFWYCWVYICYNIWCFFWIYILYGALLMLNNRWNLRNFMIFSFFLFNLYILRYLLLLILSLLLLLLLLCFPKVKVWKEIFLNLFTHFFFNFFLLLCVSKLNLHTIGMSWIFFYSFVAFLVYVLRNSSTGVPEIL